jgi:hypothetical protein
MFLAFACIKSANILLTNGNHMSTTSPSKWATPLKRDCEGIGQKVWWQQWVKYSGHSDANACIPNA